MKVLGFIVVAIIFIALVGLLAFGTYSCKRKMNYNLMYKSMVEQTIRDMVKEGALKENK